MKNLISIIKRVKSIHFVIFLCLGLLYSFVYIFQLISPLYQKYLLDTVIEESRINYFFLFVFMGTQIGIPLVSILSNLVYSRLKLKIDNHFFFQYLKLIVNQKKSRISNWGSGQYADMMFGDINRLTSSIFNLALFDLVFSIIQSVLVFFIVIRWSTTYGFICIGYMGLALLISLLFSRSQVKAYSDNRSASGEMYNELIDQLSNTQIIRHLSISHKLENSMRARYEKMQKGLLKILNLQSLPSALLGLLSGTGLVLILLVSIDLLLNKNITFGTLLAMLSYYMIIINPVNNIVDTIQRFRFATVSIKRLDNIENNYLEDNGNVPKLLPESHWGEIKVSNLDFSYKDFQPVFDKLSFGIKDGITGLVGLSGEGKSSLIKSMCQEIQLKDGLISVDGENVKHFPLRYYLFKINLLPQVIEIFNHDLEFNLTLNRQVIPLKEKDKIMKDYEQDFRRIFAELSDRIETENFLQIHKWLEKEKEMLPCLELIGIFRPADDRVNDYFEYVKTLVRNIDSIVQEISRISFEQNYVEKEKLNDIIHLAGIEELQGRNLGSDGISISGGEKQRLALARFLLREEPEFVILDEPFTSLDLITERELLAVLKSSLKDKKGLLITHNINALMNLADTFHIMQNGKITQSGKHADLINQPGLYQDLLKCFTENAIL
ncbi:MAG: ABC transporter ATP-binding protein/permease [Candidatus Cloacimonetes bacterium]|nr:ABC transporter ATP-binding protein/permease [Candidatus Cloacimonadota bacterium]